MMWKQILWIIAIYGCSYSPNPNLDHPGTTAMQFESFADQGTRFAVLVSVNDYARPKKTPSLLGPRNDMDALAEVLLKRYVFLPNNILRLHGKQATKSIILQALEALVHRAAPGKQLVFGFAGHGSYMSSPDLGESNGQDEAICPYDRDLPSVGDIRDDLLYVYFSKIVAKGAFLTVILDSCYSGNAAKEVNGLRFRTAPTLKGNARTGQENALPKHTTMLKQFAFLAAAEEHQMAGESWFAKNQLEEGHYGYFSHALIRALWHAPSTWTWGDIMVFLEQEIRSKTPGQRPVCRYGRNHLIFGREIVQGHPRFWVTKCSRNDNEVHISHGIMAGIVPGCRLAVLSKDNRIDTQIALLQVIRASPHTAVAISVPDNSPLPQEVTAGCPVIQLADDRAFKKQTVSWPKSLPAGLKSALKASLAQNSVFEIAEKSVPGTPHSHFSLHISQNHFGEATLLLTGPANPWSTFLRGKNHGDLAQEISNRIQSWIHWERLRSLKNPDLPSNAPQPLKICLNRGILTQDHKTYIPLPPLPQKGSPDVKWFQNGDILRLSYTNCVGKPLYVTVFFLNAEGYILPWNLNQYDAVLLPGKTTVIDTWIQIEPPFGKEWIKFMVNRVKPMDPAPFLPGAKNPLPPLDKHMKNWEGYWQTIDWQIQSFAKPQAPSTTTSR